MAVDVFSLARDGNKKLSTNFMVREFASKDGSDKILIDTDLVSILQKIREHFGRPVSITSAYRSPVHNRAVGGASNSFHTKGQAADFYISGVEPTLIAQYAEKLGVLAVGLYTKDRFVHVDTRTKKYFWRSAGRETAVNTHGGLPTYENILITKAKLDKKTIKYLMDYEYPYDLLEKLALAMS